MIRLIEVLRRPLEFAQHASAQITIFAATKGLTRSMGYTGICWNCDVDRSHHPVAFKLQYSRQIADFQQAA